MNNLRSPFPAGRVGKLSMDALLDRILLFIYHRKVPQAVTVDLDGRVKVQSANNALFEDTVGVYGQLESRKELREIIKEDLEDNLKTRGISGEWKTLRTSVRDKPTYQNKRHN